MKEDRSPLWILALFIAVTVLMIGRTVVKVAEHQHCLDHPASLDCSDLGGQRQ